MQFTQQMFNEIHDPFHYIQITEKKSMLKIENNKRNTKKLKEHINYQYFLHSELFNYLKDLNTTQLKVVLHGDGNIMCSAVPGAGKTKTLVYKVTYLIKYQKVNPDKILIITFTKKASNEISKRIKNSLSELTSTQTTQTTQTTNVETYKNDVISGTFHSICYKFLKMFGLMEGITHIDDEKQFQIIEQILKNNPQYNKIDQKYFKTFVKNILNVISEIKNNLHDYDNLDKLNKLNKLDNLDTKNISIDEIKNIYKKYEEYLFKHNYVDYDNLLVHLKNEINKNNTMREYLENRFDYVFVDEFQDTNSLQFEIIKYFGKKSKNITVVGDSDQSIYEWRFADSKNIIKFKNTFPNCTTYLLNHSYRSTQNIINCANSVIKQEKDRINDSIITNNETGTKVLLSEYSNNELEAKDICTKILNIIKKSNDSNDLNFPNVAILFRTNYQLKLFENSLIKYKIPYKTANNEDIYKSEEIQFLVSYLKFIVNKKDVLSFGKITQIYGDERENICNNIINNGWDSFVSNPYDKRLTATIKILKKCEKMAKLNGNVHNIINFIITKIDFYKMIKGELGEIDARKKWIDIETFINQSKNYESIENFLIDVIAFENHEALTSTLTSNCISILTVHSSKGLEWDTVFIPSVVESIYPHFKFKNNVSNTSNTSNVTNFSDVVNIAEERRLLYVGMTRAKKNLYLSHCKNIKMFGKNEQVKISRFLDDLPKDSVEFC